MFEYAIKNLEEVRDYIYGLYGNTIYDNTKLAKENKKKLEDLTSAIMVLNSIGKDDIKSRLLNILQENFMFNSYGEFNEIDTEQYKNCINSILKELGIEDNK